MWALRSVRFGYRWIVGDGTKIRFWEDTWFDTSPLSVQFWDIYIICNEQMATLNQVWDGERLKLSFRRNFSSSLMERWRELEQIASSIFFSNDCDSLIWEYSTSGNYSSSSCYNIISYRGVTPIFIPSIWTLVVPPRVHIFLWLFANNKLMTRDNMLKRNLGKPTDCIFCSEEESVDHLFFSCIVATKIWELVSEFFGISIGLDYLSVARFWIANKKHMALNTICAATLWSIWKSRNALIFDSKTWISLKQVLIMILNTLKKWRLIFIEIMLPQVDRFSLLLTKMIKDPAALPWS
jgi:mannosylglycoprotein endo-beta-mannosidase